MSVYIDSNIFIYVALHHPQFNAPCTSFLLHVQNKTIPAVTSALTLCEVYHQVQKHITQEAAQLVIQSILSFPLTVIPLDTNVFCSALHQAREHRLKINDAVHYATALSTKTTAIYSYDKDFDTLDISRVQP